ncbi:hypothetical protein SBF1_2720003 [Candidatus Desulfosporosinus infrequens]|uniref:Uncharacterized protein n=1 Tax=Candidatus Desulfosporosinus infrequens TaxID=2043169 RepID=A0A2U3KU21_9FIRM|nr:hypothetical protein SBF1_2720003 [Candidatus Desulfosporosinus infrequens]
MTSGSAIAIKSSKFACKVYGQSGGAKLVDLVQDLSQFVRRFKRN